MQQLAQQRRQRGNELQLICPCGSVLTTNVSGEVNNSLQGLHHLSRWEKRWHRRPQGVSRSQGAWEGGLGSGAEWPCLGSLSPALLQPVALLCCWISLGFLPGFFMNGVHWDSQPSLPVKERKHEGKRTGMFATTLGIKKGTLPVVRGLKIRKCSWGWFVGMLWHSVLQFGWA